jgi:hypothetical protein
MKMNPSPHFKSYKTITIINFNAIWNPIYPLTSCLVQGMFLLDEFNSRLTLDVNYEASRKYSVSTANIERWKQQDHDQFCMNIVTRTDFEID